MLFGSNYPVDKLMASYDDVVNRVATAVSSAAKDCGLDSELALTDVFERTAASVYRLR